MHSVKRGERSCKDTKLQSHTFGKMCKPSSIEKSSGKPSPKPKRLQTRTTLCLHLIWRTGGNLGLSWLYLNMFLHPLNQARAWQSCDYFTPHRRSSVFKLETGFLYSLWILRCWPRFWCWNWRKCGRDYIPFDWYDGNLKSGAETSTPIEILYTEAGRKWKKY